MQNTFTPVLLRNVDDIRSEVSDDNFNDYEDNKHFDNYFEEEMETSYQPNTEYDSDEDSDNE
ncbi:hypothetical protein BpHYR1_021606 [Brachionus plicatilis]|uniref:Uncharacterized protein n=1 Tax=Brachionus plicatilis TaxID=10195 RepID=A0A3M7T8P7_BRAPC|nr:hypothetical protein BpHYR1_021606 [Brachionus plicatilis]